MIISYWWSYNGLSLLCEMEYEAGEQSTDVMPGYGSSAYVDRVFINKVDVTDIISVETLDKISEDFLITYEQETGQYEPDYEAMREWGD